MDETTAFGEGLTFLSESIGVIAHTTFSLAWRGRPPRASDRAVTLYNLLCLFEAKPALSLPRARLSLSASC
jgi:hypothetical protein